MLDQSDILPSWEDHSDVRSKITLRFRCLPRLVQEGSCRDSGLRACISNAHAVFLLFHLPSFLQYTCLCGFAARLDHSLSACPTNPHCTDIELRVSTWLTNVHIRYLAFHPDLSVLTPSAAERFAANLAGAARPLFEPIQLTTNTRMSAPVFFRI